MMLIHCLFDVKLFQCVYGCVLYTETLPVKAQWRCKGGDWP
jgi:hypothetical protein